MSKNIRLLCYAVLLFKLIMYNIIINIWEIKKWLTENMYNIIYTYTEKKNNFLFYICHNVFILGHIMI